MFGLTPSGDASIWSVDEKCHLATTQSNKVVEDASNVAISRLQPLSAMTTKWPLKK
jgi:hypothetical protein